MHAAWIKRIGIATVVDPLCNVGSFAPLRWSSSRRRDQDAAPERTDACPARTQWPRTAGDAVRRANHRHTVLDGTSPVTTNCMMFGLLTA